MKTVFIATVLGVIISGLFFTTTASPSPQGILAAEGDEAGVFPVGSGPFDLVFDGANIWVANTEDNTVMKLDLKGNVLGTFFVGDKPVALAFDGTSIWVANYLDDNVMKLSLNGQLLETHQTGYNPDAIVYDGLYIWVAHDSCGTLTRINAENGFTWNFDIGCESLQSLGMENTNLWISYASGLMKYNSGKILVTLSMDIYTLSPVYDGNSIWAAIPSRDEVVKLTTDGTQLGTFPVGKYPRDLLYDGEAIWVANVNSDTVTKLALDGSNSGTFAVGDGPYALAFDGTHLWVANKIDGTVTKLVTSFTPGEISVNSEPQGASFTLSGPESFEGITPWSTTTAPAGSYTISWNDMPYHTTPGSRIETLAAGESIVFNSVYSEVVGGLSVDSNPSGASFTLSGAQMYSGTTPWSEPEAPAGSYTIDWEPMEGYDKPDSRTQELVMGEFLSFYGVYEDVTQELVGTLHVDSSPSGASFTLSGAQIYSGITPWSVSDAPAGSYTIDWDSMEGYNKPNSRTQELSEGESLSFHCIYVEVTQTEPPPTASPDSDNGSSLPWTTILASIAGALSATAAVVALVIKTRKRHAGE